MLARVLGKIFFIAPESNLKASFRMMRHETSQTLISKRLNKPRSIKLMQPRSLQAWRIPYIVNITSGDQHVAITTALQRHRFRKTLCLDTHSAHMTPTPRLRLRKPQLRKLTSVSRIDHTSYSTSRPCLHACWHR